MSNIVIPTQIFPDCNTTTKFNIDLLNQRFIINDLGFDFDTFKDKPFSRQYLQFINVKNYTIDSSHWYFDTVFDDEKEQYVFNDTHFMYITPLTFNLTMNKFKSYAIIDNEYYYAPHNGRIWRFTKDGNLLPQYSPTDNVDNYEVFTFLKQIGDYVIWFTNNGYDNFGGMSSHFYIHHKHDCRNYTRINIDDERPAILVDFDDDLNQITILQSTHSNHELVYKIIKIPETPDETLTVLETSSASQYRFEDRNDSLGVSSKVFNCDNLYDLGIYVIFLDTERLQLMNIDKVNKVLKRYDVNIDWNGFTFDATDYSQSYVSNKYDSEITLGVMFDDSHFDLYRIVLTGDLEGTCVAKTTFDLEDHSNNYRMQRIEFETNKLVNITNSKTSKIIKYISEFKTFVEIKSFNNDFATLYDLKNNRILVSELQYSSIMIREISFDSEIRFFIKSYPETIAVGDTKLLEFGLYDIIKEEYVPDIPLRLELTEGAVFKANGLNYIEFKSSDHLMSLEIKAVESKAVELYYSIG